MKNLEKYFGGKPKTFFNKKGDIVMMKGKKKIRFDTKKLKNDRPHFHIQEEIKPGVWKNVIKHRHYFKD